MLRHAAPSCSPSTGGRALSAACLLGVAGCDLSLPASRSEQSAPSDSVSPAGPPPSELQTPARPRHPVEPCRLKESAYAGIGLGYPRSHDRLRSLGEVEAVVLFADFPDAPAEETPESVLALLQPAATDFLRAVSYGRMELSLRPQLRWLRMGQSAAAYGEAIRSFSGHRDWLREAIELADAEVDFAGAELVLLLANPDAKVIGYGPTWLGHRGAGGFLEADGARITNGITSGADLRHWGGLWLSHELGHSLGLVDLYQHSGSSGFTRPFSLMDLISSEAPELFAYERWLLGWLDDAQIVCLRQSEEVHLSPVEREGGVKAAMMPLSETRMLVVESRRALGWDASLQRGGALVYLVDSSRPTGQGSIQALHDREPLRPGEALEHEGVRIRLEQSEDWGDRVAVSRP